MQNIVDIPVTLKVNAADLQQPPSRPTPQTGIAVASSAEELAQLSGAKMAMLIGYHEGSTKGGGTFIHSPGIDGPHIGDWVLQPGQTVTPFHFGTGEGGEDEDSGEALQLFFDFCAQPSARGYQIYGGGRFGSSIPLKIEGAGYVYSVNFFIKALDAMDEVLTFKSCRGSVWSGKIAVQCFGDQWLSKRQGVNGIRIDDCRGAKLCNLSAKEGSGWGVYFGAGNNNMCTVEDVSTTDMGATGKDRRTHSVSVASYRNNEHNTIHQSTLVTLSPGSIIPSDAHQIYRAFWISAAGEPYKIIGVDRAANAVRVYPMVPDAEQTLDSSQLVYGGGVCCYSGGHTAKAKIGHVSAMRSGIGCWLTGQSSANVEGYTGQFCGVDMVLGSDPDNTFGGSFFGSVYFEASEFADLVYMNQTRTNSHGTIFGSSTALDLSDWISMEPKRTNTKGRSTTKQYFPITFMYEGSLWYPGLGGERSQDEGNYGASATQMNGAPQFAQPFRNTTKISLRHSEQAERFRGVLPVTFHLYGQQGDNGSFHNPIPVVCQEGYTINGSNEPLVILPRGVPITLHALLERDDNWIVTYTEHQVPS